MWIPAQTTVPPLALRPQCRRHQLPDRGEDDRRVELLRAAGAVRSVPAHSAPSSRANACALVVARAG